MAVREIRGWHPATPLPHAPPFVIGVINLRGAVLPILDLSARFGLGVITPDRRHVIIVCRIGRQLVGLLVDAVLDILMVTEDMIQPTPDLASEAAVAFVRGVLAIEGRMISLIGLDRLLPDADAEAA